MTDTDFPQPDPGRPRAAAKAAELAQAVSGLFSIDGCRLAGDDPLAPLARGIARSVTEAGLPLHHCPRHHLPYRTGGVCVLAVRAESGTGRAGIAVSRTAHNPAPAGPGQVRHLYRHAAGHDHRARHRPVRLRVPMAGVGSNAQPPVLA